MKLQLELLIIGSLFVYVCSTSCTEDDWLKFKEKYKKTYKSTEDELNHHKIYCKNIKIIEEHNNLYKRGASAYEMGVNKFADMSSKELSRFFHANGPAQETHPGLIFKI